MENDKFPNIDMRAVNSAVPCWTALSCHSWILAHRCTLQPGWSPQS